MHESIYNKIEQEHPVASEHFWNFVESKRYLEQASKDGIDDFVVEALQKSGEPRLSFEVLETVSQGGYLHELRGFVCGFEEAMWHFSPLLQPNAKGESIIVDTFEIVESINQLATRARAIESMTFAFSTAMEYAISTREEYAPASVLLWELMNDLCVKLEDLSKAVGKENAPTERT